MTTHLESVWLLLCLSVMLTLAGCQPAGDRDLTKSGDGTPGNVSRLVAVSYPLQQMAQQLIGDGTQVALASGDEDPRHWRPGREEVLAMQQADLVIANGTGATYADWLATVSLADRQCIDTASRGLSLKDYIAVEDVRIVHAHGPEGEHSHATMVSRTWLDPRIAAKQAVYLADRLAETYPEQTEQIEGRCQTLEQQLLALADSIPQPDPSADPAVVSATFEMKFLTRACGLTDHHLNWDEQTTAEQAKRDLEQILKASPKSARPTRLLVPDYLFDHVTGPLSGVVESQQLQPVRIDLLDRPQPDAGWQQRLAANVEAVTDPTTSPEPSK